MLYKSSTTFGRFNIPHYGHSLLIRRMLDLGEFAHVFVSTGSLNNDWDLRVLALKAVCRRDSVDLSRVRFLKSGSPYSAVIESIKISEFGETTLVVGGDQYKMGLKLQEDLDIPLSLNNRVFSSTNVRYLIDQNDFNSLETIYKSSYPMRLALELRKEEIHRERLIKTAKKVS